MDVENIEHIGCVEFLRISSNLATEYIPTFLVHALCDELDPPILLALDLLHMALVVGDDVILSILYGKTISLANLLRKTLGLDRR